MTNEELFQELTNDPKNIGYPQMTAEEKAAALNHPRGWVTFPVIVPVATILLILDSALEAIESLQDPVKKMAWRARIENIRSLKEGFRPVDVAAQLTAGVADGVFDQQMVDTLFSLGTRSGSRAEELWGEGSRISLNDIAKVI